MNFLEIRYLHYNEHLIPSLAQVLTGGEGREKDVLQPLRHEGVLVGEGLWLRPQEPQGQSLDSHVAPPRPLL